MAIHSYKTYAEGESRNRGSILKNEAVINFTSHNRDVLVPKFKEDAKLNRSVLSSERTKDKEASKQVNINRSSDVVIDSTFRKNTIGSAQCDD